MVTNTSTDDNDTDDDDDDKDVSNMINTISVMKGSTTANLLIALFTFRRKGETMSKGAKCDSCAKKKRQRSAEQARDDKTKTIGFCFRIS